MTPIARAGQGLVALACAGLLGCASIVSKSSYPVQINTQPAGANVTVKNDSGTVVFTGRTPAVVTLAAGNGYFKGANYTVLLEKDGYVPFNTTVTRSIDLWYVAGNAVFGGLIGWLIVDPLTGAMWKLENVNQTMTQSAGDLDPGQLHVATLDQLPAELRAQLVPLR